ncbi:short chain dehydrogenase [Calothrix sp. HK-06]|nr:short chain dehydrogenase [Calothrix sp. HK-06]
MAKNKVAIVTGASSGIGRACAIAFAREKVKVVVARRRIEQGEETVKILQEAGGEGLFIQTDVSIEEDVASLVEKTIEFYDRIDYAFNNAGVEQSLTPLSEQTSLDFDKIININVKGIWLCMKYQIPYMLHHGNGVIVNMSSIFGLVGFPKIPIYCASKHAVIGLTKSLAIEYAKQGIRINAVCPGFIDTEMISRGSIKTPELIDYVKQLHPIGRIGTSEEVANAVIWLCSDQASFITGIALNIDGGFVAS